MNENNFIVVIFREKIDLKLDISNASAGFYLGGYFSRISGSHLNPAVTFACCVFRKFPWKKFPSYVLAQFLGAFLGSFIVYGNYKSAIDVFEGGPNIRTVPGYSNTATAGMFWSYPAEFMTTTGRFFSEFIGASILMASLFAFKDEGTLGGEHLFPLNLFFIIFSIGLSFGWETGYALNLARDLGPRLMTYCVGYGPEVWTAGDHFFWVRPMRRRYADISSNQSSRYRL
jgi:aquaglyceroporin related protein, other eukaryote